MAHLVYSFSVFDACLMRQHARPADQLFALAARVLPGGGDQGEPDREDLHEFVRLRLKAEQDARTGPNREAPSLGMVYQRFPTANPWHLDPEALYATELEMILSQALPVPVIAERVRGHIRRGERVVYLSDTLLPGPALRRLLESHGFAGEAYCAGELGKTKATGALYLHALAAQSIDARQMLHTGSDPVLDARVPRALGIATAPLIQARFTPHEQFLLARQRASTPEASRAVAASRLARLSAEIPDEHQGLLRFAANVAAPALTAFVAWAMDQAAQRGAKRLYFLAREGEVLHHIAQALAPAMGGPQPRYLMGSLAAWTAPLLAELTREDLAWLAAGHGSQNLAGLLERLGLTQDELPGAMPGTLADPQAPLSPDGLDALWAMLDTPGPRALLAQRSSQARSLMLGYLRQEGALDDPLLAVADMGWTLFTQRALKMALAPDGRSVEGWYFGLSRERMGRMEAGAHHALFLERVGQAVPGTLENAIFRNIRLLEGAFARASHGKILGYHYRGPAVTPILGPPPPGLAEAEIIRTTAVAFAKAFAAGATGQAARTALLGEARQSLQHFFAQPDRAMVRALAALPGLTDGQRPVLRPLGATDALKAWLASLGAHTAPTRPPSWPEGAAALSRAWLRPYLRSPKLQNLLQTYFS